MRNMIKTACAVVILSIACNATAEAGALKKIMIGAGVIVVAGTVAQHANHGAKRVNSDSSDDLDLSTAGSYSSSTAHTSASDEISVEIEKRSKGSEILRGSLNIDRIAIGLAPFLTPGPGSDCEPHHIVPEKDARKGIREHTDPARKLLERCNIYINSSQNGIFLPKGEGIDGCEGPHNHRTIHNGPYYEPVNERLQNGYVKNRCQGVRDALAEIKEILKIGGMP